MIKASNLSKRFNGQTAVDAVSLQVDKGQIFGLLWPFAARLGFVVVFVHGEYCEV